MKRKIILDKRAYFFTLDAFIALLLILGIVLFVRPSIHRTSPRVDVQDDLLHVLSKLEVGEIDNVYVQSLIASGKITNLDQSVLEQIGEFYAESNPEANLMAQSILDELNPDNDVGFYFGGYVGDGNITVEFDDNIVSAEIEADFGGDFELLINGISIGTYPATP